MEIVPSDTMSSRDLGLNDVSIASALTRILREAAHWRMLMSKLIVRLGMGRDTASL